MSIETHTLCNESADFLEPVIRTVLPYVDICRIYCDESSNDGTKDIIKKLQKNEKVKVKYYNTDDPYRDLVKARNMGLEDAACDWIWILDDDEIYLKEDIPKIIEELENSDKDGHGVRFWFVTGRSTHHHYRGKTADRFFRNKKGLEWKGLFTREAICDEIGILRHDKHPNMDILPYAYLHLSALKKHTWRKKLGKKKHQYPEYWGRGKLLPFKAQEALIKIL